MSVHTLDRMIVRWADRHRLRYYYTPERLSERGCLRVHLGHVTADFGLGKLVRLNIHSEGCCLNDAFCELTQLFDFCRRAGAFVDPPPVASDEGRGWCGV